ncbi:MAG: ribbon-helix-helix protein, CopG family [Alphaproteobacteria bacterium]|nr:ribbon-helix-helix protein, CopG family [Alphaproteobacteria bacterium]
MAPTVSVAAHVSRKTGRGLAKLAEATGRSMSQLVAQAVVRYLAEEKAYLAAIAVGLRDFREGRVTDHETVVAELKRRRRR